MHCRQFESRGSLPYPGGENGEACLLIGRLCPKAMDTKNSWVGYSISVCTTYHPHKQQSKLPMTILALEYTKQCNPPRTEAACSHKSCCWLRQEEARSDNPGAGIVFPIQSRESSRRRLRDIRLRNCYYSNFRVPFGIERYTPFSAHPALFFAHW